MKTLEQRVTDLENVIKKIIALPHLSNLAGRDSKNFVARIKMSIASDKKKLARETLSDDERKETEERIARSEFLVSPALDVKLDDSESTKSPNAQEVRAE